MPFAETIAVSLVSALIAGFVGYRFALRRERRHEWNALVEPIYLALLGMRKNPTGRLAEVDNARWPLIRNKLRPWRRRRFDRALEKYQQSRGEENREPNGMGGFHYRDTARIAHTVENLLRFVKPW